MNGKHSRYFPEDVTHLTDDEGGLEAGDSHRCLCVVTDPGCLLPAAPEPRVLQIHHDGHQWPLGSDWPHPMM